LRAHAAAGADARRFLKKLRQGVGLCGLDGGLIDLDHAWGIAVEDASALERNWLKHGAFTALGGCGGTVGHFHTDGFFADELVTNAGSRKQPLQRLGRCHGSRYGSAFQTPGDRSVIDHLQAGLAGETIERGRHVAGGQVDRNLLGLLCGDLCGNSRHRRAGKQKRKQRCAGACPVAKSGLWSGHFGHLSGAADIVLLHERMGPFFKDTPGEEISLNKEPSDKGRL